MSIYPVHLMSWFPKRKNGKLVTRDDLNYHENAKFMVKETKCLTCGKHCTWHRAWGHHSIPWGHGDIWCSKKCVFGGK